MKKIDIAAVMTLETTFLGRGREDGDFFRMARELPLPPWYFRSTMKMLNLRMSYGDLRLSLGERTQQR